MPSHEWKLYHRDDTDKNHTEIWPTPRYEPPRDMNYTQVWTTLTDQLQLRYWMACSMRDELRSEDKEGLRSETRERRKWVDSVSELRTRGKVINGAFLSSISLFSWLLHPSWLHSISARYTWRRHGFKPPPERSQLEVEFPRALDMPKCYSMVPIGCGTYEFVWERMRHDFLISFFLSFTVVRFMQPRRSAPKEGNNLMAEHDLGPGNGHSIYSTRHKP
jgi:hypothetical protein